MSTEFNPATFEHEGVVYEAQPRLSDTFLCQGCAFRGKNCFDLGPCEAEHRHDGIDIRWVVRAQEGKKS